MSAPDEDEPHSDATATDDLVYVADREEFEETDRIIVDVRGREIAVFDVDGEFHALANHCVHQGGPVCEGMLSGGITAGEGRELEYNHEDQLIACPWHGWEFDVESGVHLARPKYRLPTYEVVVRDASVYLDL